MTKHFISLLIILFLAGCTSQPRQPTSDVDEARATLVGFLTSLNTGNYEEAVPLYGGEYESLQVFNTQIEPADRLALWRWVCENRLLQCLEVRSAVLQHQEAEVYVFQVEFNNPDGSLFVLGPCCGANETEMPPVSEFEFTVIRNPGRKFVVMNTPPYVP